MEVSEVLHMNKGEGETSYAKNSIVQGKIISIAEPITNEAILKLSCTNFSDIDGMGIADLGCSSGPNTLSVISDILDIVHAKCLQLGRPSPEFRVHLNDLPSNDFNDIFMSLPAFYKLLNEEKGTGFGPCFIFGVPGSFYGRLFPRNSLHFVHSSSSLHWLSQVPPGLDSNASMPLNKGKIYISKTSPSCVLDAYSVQFQKDFSLFLQSRSAEVVPEGRMVLAFMGRSTLDPTTEESCYQWELLAQVLRSMVLEGLVQEEKVDAFNAPYYAPCPEEVKNEIEKEGSFIIDALETFEIDWDGGDICNDKYTSNGTTLSSSGEKVAKTIRAVVESMLESQFKFGSDRMDDFFQRYSDVVNDHLSKTRTKYVNLVLSIVKKS